jgi:Glycosyl hydrolases family 18
MRLRIFNNPFAFLYAATMKCLLAATTLLLLTATGFSANWPARVFVPYMYIGADDNFKITHCADVCGQKYYTIAFIITNKRRSPAWYGRIPMDRNLYADQIDSIRKQGGDVIVSFGGADGTELAIAETNSALLEAKYQSVIDQYKFSWLDFDIEGDALTNQTANVRRNLVLTRLQAKNPGLIISFTLPVDPDGISVESLGLLVDAKAQGVKVHSVNVMTMDFGAHFSKGRPMSDVSVVSTIKAHEQCQPIDPAIQIGVTPMIGQNDKPGEIFTQEDAKALFKWAQAQPWICSLSFWASNRDAGKSGKKGTGNHTSGIEQKPWEFTLIFKPFTTPY